MWGCTTIASVSLQDIFITTEDTRTQSQSPIVFPNVHNYQLVFCLCELVSQNFWIWFLSLMFLNFIPFND